MSKFLHTAYKKHFTGPGGISELLPIAFPMFVSSVFDMLMMFIDRLYLSHVGVVHQAAAMSGGIASWMVVSFFVGIIRYSSVLVSQYHGAGQKDNCIQIIWQALFLGLVSYPLILLVDCAVSASPLFSTLPPQEFPLAQRYFWYMGFGSIFAIGRFVFSSLFAGIGRTRVIMYANMLALVINVCVNWLLIFGHWGFPALGLDGAAIGTILSGFATALMLAICFLREKKRPEWQKAGAEAACRTLDWGKIRKLLRYGFPQGVEDVLCMTCFVSLVTAFHSYGEDMATATTICFNWDGFSFHPLLGIQAAVTTLVGQAMGKRNPQLALRSARSGFKVALFYAGCMIAIFWSLASPLVSIFTPESSGLDYGSVREYAVPMLRMAGLYLMTDAILLISAGTLRGAGDTFWSMMIHFINQTITAGIIFFCVHSLHLPPFTTWVVFVLLAMLGSMTLLLRYRHGRWKRLQIIEH